MEQPIGPMAGILEMNILKMIQTFVQTDWWPQTGL